MFKGNTVTKIGQYPSLASKEKLELKKFKSLKIVKKYYIELMRSVDAYSQHMGIAALVYLRRIYEHIVETEYSKLSIEKNEKASFDEKMKAVDKEIHIIPEALASQKSKIYSVLSKGIHEYDEDECYEMYPVIRNVILFILNRYLTQKKNSSYKKMPANYLLQNKKRAIRFKYESDSSYISDRIFITVADNRELLPKRCHSTYLCYEKHGITPF